jgi:hypothetical protein
MSLELAERRAYVQMVAQRIEAENRAMDSLRDRNVRRR